MSGAPDDVNCKSTDKIRESWSYSGSAWTDSHGKAIVVLPPFVRVHPAGFDYEVTPVDSGCSAFVAKEILDDRFTIRTDKPHTKVAWRVTARRAAGKPSPSESGGPLDTAREEDSR
jgi:hypothetical protein